MKKGDLSMNTIVVAVLCLVVLMVLIFVFRDQVFDGVKGFDFAKDDALQGLNGTKCQTLITGYKCMGSDKCPGSEWKIVDGDFEDCKSGQNCCERKNS